MRKITLIALFGLCLLGPSTGFGAEAVPATNYFPVLPLDAPEDAEPQLVPLAANKPLDDVVQVGVTRAIIVIHDETRDANEALATMAALAGSQNESTIILAPQFLLPSDIVRFADSLPEKGQGFAAWQVGGWVSGDDSMPIPQRKSVSSFTVLDLILMFLTEHEAFPDLKQIVVTGSGAGANYVQRYAAFTSAADVVAKQNIDLRFVLAGATSYLYLTPSRPLGPNGFGVPDTAACPNYNAYPYGLDKLNAYARRKGENAAKVDYATRFITYLNAYAADAVPESNCAVLDQGHNSVERGDNFRLYLQTLYGDVALKTQKFSFEGAKGNDAVSLYGSACGMSALFGDGTCPPARGGLR